MKDDNRATESLLGELHGLIARGLIEKIKSGEATSADFNAAIKFLKDNNISCIGTENNDIQDLVAALPVYDDTVFYNHDEQGEYDKILRAH